MKAAHAYATLAPDAVPMVDLASKVAAVQVPLSQATILAMDEVIDAVQALVTSPHFRAHALAQAGDLASAPLQPDFGLFSGFDFHLTASGPKLIEVNTNAGGAFYGALIDDQRFKNGVPGTHPLSYWSGLFLRQIRNEWALANKGALKTVAIIDDVPEHQFLRLEFQLAAEILRGVGIAAIIAAPQDLTFDNNTLRVAGEPIDLVYNRLTGFALDREQDAAMREALRAGAVWITPGPRAHALLACKRNLALMSDEDFLMATGISEKARHTLLQAVPKTVLLTPENVEELWESRDGYYFKPLSGYGSRGVYAGSKLTRKTWDKITASARYVAQAEVPPSRIDVPDFGAMRCDVRSFAYEGKSFMRLARLYRGQTTNFRTPGGGFAPIVIT